MKTRAIVFCVGMLIQSPCFAEYPNVILVMADDMGMGDTSAYQDVTGNSDEDQIATPAMERLARMGVRFTDAHTPSTRCTATRYGLLTGRSPWRTELKHFVLFGSQGDPLIERDRPTLATLFRKQGYGTGMMGKWHVGLRYRQSDGRPAAGWEDADLTQPLFDCPLDHGFDEARYTSRSHGTCGSNQFNTGLQAKKKKKGKGKAGKAPGPGHLHGRRCVSANGPRSFHSDGANAYVLHDLGRRHSDHAMEYLSSHVAGGDNAHKPFFLYYASNSNHTPHTPAETIGGVAVQGASTSKAGAKGNRRWDFIYENDVALNRFINWLISNDDPRNPGKKLIETTIVIFTSDNGAEVKAKTATGPFRSNKGSCYEGGHRVPFIVSWGGGGIGDGEDTTPGQTNSTPISLCDLYATFAELMNVELPNLRAGKRGAEDSVSALAAFRGQETKRTIPMFVNDHSEAKSGPDKDPAVLAMRMDDPVVDGQMVKGRWKVLFKADLVRNGEARPMELYNLAVDPREVVDWIGESEYWPLVKHLCEVATVYRDVGGIRLANMATKSSVTFDWSVNEMREKFHGRAADTVTVSGDSVAMLVTRQGAGQFHVGKYGLGIGNEPENPDATSVDGDEALSVSFTHDVIVESLSLYSHEADCGGFYQIDEGATRALTCVNADAEMSQDQFGQLRDLGVLKAGSILRLDSRPHEDADLPGNWSLQSITVQPLH